MKIVHVMSWYIPNMGYQENFLPAEQKKLGHDVTIITSDRHPLYSGINDNTSKVKPGKYSDKNIEIYRLPVLFEYKKSGELILRGLKKLLKKLDPDIVHVHSAFSLMALQAIRYQKHMNYKLFIDDHSHMGNYSIDTFAKKVYIHLVKKYYLRNKRRVTCLLPVQYSSEEVLKSNLPADINIKILHLGANDVIFRPSEKDRVKIRRKYGIDDDEILIVTSGKFDETKDIYFLIEGLKSILKKERYKLLLIGNGPKEYMDILRKHSKEIGKNKIIFIDFLKNSELNKYYNAADIGVWPGNHSIGVIEAVSAGLPVILPDNDIAYKILFDNKAAIGFKRKNLESLLKSVRLLSDKYKREEIRKNGLLLISKELSWTRIAKKSLEYYTNLENRNDTRVDFATGISKILKKFLPKEFSCPIIKGRLKGKKWIIKSGNLECLLGTYEKDKIDLFEECLSKKHTIYDIGAHVGYYSLLASHLVGDEGKVIAFEPLPENIAYLTKHIKLNKCGNVKVIKAAVSDKKGTAKFSIGSNGYIGHLSSNGDISVDVVSLDELIKTECLPIPNVIKIDVEGAEFSVLKGAEMILKNHAPKILLATHEKLCKDVHKKCCDYLTSLGYRIQAVDSKCIENTNEIFAYKNHIGEV